MPATATGPERPAQERTQEVTMQKLITFVALAFVLAAGSSMVALTVHVDRAHVDQASPHKAAQQRMSLLY
jgi:hypothetical protein